MRKVSPRAIAAVMLAAGLLVGSLFNPSPARTRQRVGEYWLLAGDFHVHAFPGDGSLAPWAVRDEAAGAGLDVIALTNHNQVFTARLARWLAGFSEGPIVLVGQEVTNPDYHIAAIGLERAVRADQPAAAAIAEIHAQGGVAVAAHPARNYPGFDDAAVARLDGTEFAHPAMHVDERPRLDFAEFFARARRLNPRASPIGSSDFHATPSLGACRTFVLARQWSAAGVLEAIRNGMTVAADQDGRLYGDPALVALIESSLPAGRADPHPRRRRLAVTLAWLGILGILLCRGGLGQAA